MDLPLLSLFLLLYPYSGRKSINSRKIYYFICHSLFDAVQKVAIHQKGMAIMDSIVVRTTHIPMGIWLILTAIHPRKTIKGMIMRRIKEKMNQNRQHIIPDTGSDFFKISALRNLIF